MKKVFIIIIISFLALSYIYAQVPQAINYQAILRGNTGYLLSNRNINMKISILPDSTNGITVYSESHNTTTTVYGLVNLAIGSGTVLTGDFDTIHWGNTDHFVKIEIDTTGGNNYFETGISQLLSVPYAQFAKEAGNVNYSDTSATNELQEFYVSGDTLFLSNGNYVILPGVGPVIQDTSQFLCGDTLLDTRDWKEYATVLIGTQCWMAENLNIGIMIDGSSNQTNNTTIEKYCYGDNTSNCDTYGGLYQWDETMQYVLDMGAQGICPSGWHIPTDDEWKILEGTVDSQYGVGDPEWDDTSLRGFDAGDHLKSTTGWYNNGNGDDSYGFTALPGGRRDNSGNFYSFSMRAYFWSSMESSDTHAWYRQLLYNSDEVDRNGNYKTFGFSVRCLKN